MPLSGSHMLTSQLNGASSTQQKEFLQGIIALEGCGIHGVISFWTIINAKVEDFKCSNGNTILTFYFVAITIR